MDSNSEYLSSDEPSVESSSEDSFQSEVSEEEILYVLPPIRRRRLESDTEDEVYIENENENEHSNDIDSDDWSSLIQPAASVIPFVKSRTAVRVDGNHPQDFYFAFVTEEILQTIVDETNTYAEQYKESRSSTRLDKWTPTNRNEMKRFLGLLIWMGLVKLPKLDAYWCTNNTYCQSFPRKVMSKNRFELLLRFLHFANNRTANRNDGLYKIRRLLDALNQNFCKHYDLDEAVCIDGSLIPFRGRAFRQFLKQRRCKCGVKVFKLCAGQGYTYRFEMFSEKTSNVPCLTPTSIVLNVCNDILHRGHTIYADSWCASIGLAEKLIDRNTHLVGTVRKSKKGIPVEVKLKKLRRGELIAMQNRKGVMVLKWRDDRDVLMVSTKHSAETVAVRKNNFTREKPTAVLDYSLGKRAVDLSDQMTAYSAPYRRTLKWYLKLAMELLLNASITNALVLYRLATSKKIKVSEFRMALAMHLTRCHDEEAPEVSSVSSRRGLRHEMQKKEGPAHLARKFCKECYKKNVESLGQKIAKNRTKKVTTYCPDCVDQPYLCLKCFNVLHR